MTRRRAALPILLALSLLAALLGAGPVARRIQFDRINTRIRAIADMRGFREVARAAAKSDPALLADLASAGVSAMAMRPCSTDQIAADGLLQYLPAATAGHTRMRLVYPDRFSLASACVSLFPGTTLAGDTLDVPVSGELFRSTPLFLDHELAQRVREAGLDVVYRLPNAPWAGRGFLKHITQAVPRGATVVFDEDSALGWPSDIPLVATLFHARGLRVGDVEFSGQDGVRELLGTGKVESLFIHSIPPRELAKLPYERLMPRWRRAADERNIRWFYLHPLPQNQIPRPGLNLYDASLGYVRDFAAGMTAAGYEPGDPVDAAAFLSPATGGDAGQAAKLAGALGAAALTAAVILQLELIPGLIVGLLMLPLAAGLAMSPKAAALAAAIAAPALSAILFDRRTSHGAGFFRIAAELLLLLVINLIGGTLIYEILCDPAYVTHRAAFSGVKLVYLGPLVLALVELIRRDRIPLLATRPTLFDLALLGAVALGGLFYVARSGNFSPVPASAAEHGLRDRLEAALPARPRTKEFLIGYPALTLLAFLGAGGPRRNWRASLLLLGAGAVAPVSIANAFCHLHSPYLLSVKRCAVGLAAGLLFAALAWPFRRAVGLLGGAPYLSLSGYFGYGNCGDDWILRRQVAALSAAAGGRYGLLVFARAGTPPPIPEARIASRWSPLQIASGMLASRAHVSGGGGLYQDATGRLSTLYYLLYPAAARFIGMPFTGLIGQSFGSLTSPTLRYLVAWYASRAQLVMARDARSAANLAAWIDAAGGRGRAVPEIAPDAFFWERVAQPAPAPRRFLGLALRPSSRLSRPSLEALVAASRDTAKTRGLTVRFLLLHPAFDRPLIAGLAKDEELVEVTPGGGLADFAPLAAVVAMRYHAMVFAACSETPLLAVSYDSKTDAFLEETAHPHRLDLTAPGQPDTAAAARRALDTLLVDPASSTRQLAGWASREFEAGADARSRFIRSVREAVT